jgi:hypothetical protein
MNNPLNSLQQTARSAFYGTSFSPEKRGQRVVNEYGAELLEDIDEIKKAASKFDQDATAAIARYTEKYKQYISRWLHSQSNCYSTMIAGPSNFPVRQQQKRHKWADNRYSEFREWRTRVLAKICKSFAPATTPLTELEKAKADLQGCIDSQETMKRVNKFYPTFKKNPEALETADFLEAVKKYIREWKPLYSFEKVPFQRYSLTNNSANIRRLRQRVAMLEAKAVKHEAGEQNEATINGVRILQNYTDDRVQIFFNGKPAPEIIQLLKSRGWRWSPFNKCWQRKLTNDATYSAKQIAEQVKG